jgi:hypothetical protein
MADKIYIKASVKQSKFGLNLSGKAEDVIAQLKEHTNEKGYFNWEINPRKEIGKYGETHSVTVNQWKPDNVAKHNEQVKDVAGDSLPF